MQTPVSTRPRRSLGVLVYPFVLGLVFAATAALAHYAGTRWSPKPDWSPAPSTRHLAPTRTGPLEDGCDRTTPSGLRYAVLARGDSATRPGPHDTVKVRFAGWSSDGVPLAGVPADGHAQLSVDHVIPGWSEGLQLMSVGDRLRLCVPESLGYKGRPGIPPGTLVFEVELLAITVQSAAATTSGMSTHSTI